MGMKIEDRLTLLKVGRWFLRIFGIASVAGLFYGAGRYARCQELLGHHKDANTTLNQFEARKKAGKKWDSPYENPRVKNFLRFDVKEYLELEGCIESLEGDIRDMRENKLYKDYEKEKNIIPFSGYGGLLGLVLSGFGLYKSNKKIKWIEKTIEPLKKKQNE
jgi:hypothetical protein